MLKPNPANNFAVPPQRIESLRWLSGALGSLREMIDGADAAPSPDAREAYSRLQPMADASLATWRRFVTEDLEAFNQRLRTAGRKAIAVSP